MTPQEIVEAHDVANRKLLESRNLPVSPAILELMNQASINGFALGSQMATSMMNGSLAVMLAKLKK
jgi:hypothetical protein